MGKALVVNEEGRGRGREIPFSLNFWHSGVKRGEGRGRRAFFECLKLMKKSLLL